MTSILGYFSRGLLAAATTWILYLLGLVIYRLYFHPLSKFPGPKHAAISRWHEFYYEVVCKGQFSAVIRDYHEKYGPIVRIVPDELHIQDSEFYDTLYTKAGRVDKYDWMSGRFLNESSGLATPSADLHTLRRKALNPFFSRAKIIELEDVIRDKIQILVNHIDAYHKEGKAFRLSSGFMALAGDVIMQYAFSLDYHHLDSPGFSTTFHEPFMASSITGHLSLQFPIVPKILFSLPEAWLAKIQPLFARVFKMRTDLKAQIAAVREGKKSSAATSTGLSIFRELIADPELPDAEKQPQRLQDEAQVVIAGGITTTGWSLSVGAFHIISKPEIYNKLHKELVEAIPDPEATLKWSDLEKLPYLSGCIKESIRLSYPVTSRNPRLHHKPLVYKNWVIPTRTPVSMTITDVNKDEEIFPNHEKFDPERWIGNPKTKDGESLERYFVCFQKGTRSCLGMNLAYAELYLIMATVYRRYRFELYETDQSDVEVIHDFFLPSPKMDSKGIRVKCVEQYSA